MKRFLPFIILLLAVLPGKAQTFTEWHDAEVNAINRAPMYSTFKIYDSEEQLHDAYKTYIGSDSYTLSLNGKWDFHFAENADERAVGFFAPDYDTSSWGEIMVPAVHPQPDLR